jgi:peptidoglycan/LPS O-acetylase OafA/YrhL
VAVVAVLLFHGGVSWAKGGFLGVDAFFVLSGYLITTLLLREVSDPDGDGRVDLGHFWSRRARRLLPALLVVVAAAGVYGLLLAPRGSLAGLRKDAIATLFYVANWRYIQAGANYFEATAAPSILRHTWSLAIEEQFYLVWPLVVAAVARLWRRSAALVIGAVGVVAGLGTAASAAAMWVRFRPGEDVSRAYFGTDTRVQVVLTGALLAAVLAGVEARRSGASSGHGSGQGFLGLGRVPAAVLGAGAAVGTLGFLAAVAVVAGDETPLFRGGFLVISVGVALVLAHIVLVPDGWSSRLCSVAPLRALGLVSYGLYLWHWPIYLTMTRARTGLDGPALLAARLAVTGVVATASYFLVELPIRRGALPRMQAVVGATLAMGLAAAVVLVGTELPPPRPAAAEVVRTESGYPTSRRPARPEGEPARVLVVGDSVGETLARRYVRPARRSGIAMTNKGLLGCGVVRGGPYRYFGKQLTPPRNCESWPRQWSEHVGRYDPDVVLAVLGRWEVMDRVHDGRWTAIGDPVFDRYLETELTEAVRVLSAGDATVLFTTAPYYFRGERPDGGRWPEDDPARVDRFNAILRGVVDRHADRAALLDLNAKTSVGGVYTPVVDGISLRFDGVHFSPEGANWLAPWFFGALLECAPPVAGGGARRPVVTTVAPAEGPAPSPPPSRPPRTAPTTSPTSAPPPTTEPPPSTTETTEPPTTTTTRPPLPTLPAG